MKKSLALLVAGILLLGLGCKSPGQMISEKASEKLAEKMIEKASGGQADVDLSGGTMKVTTKDGSTEFGGTTLPDNWPNDAPVYPGASVQFSSSNTGVNGQMGAMVVFQTKDGGKTVLDYYKKELAAQGWKINETYQTGDGAMLATTKDSRTLAATIASGDDSSVDITLVLGSK